MVSKLAVVLVLGYQEWFTMGLLDNQREGTSMMKLSNFILLKKTWVQCPFLYLCDTFEGFIYVNMVREEIIQMGFLKKLSNRVMITELVPVYYAI